MNKYKNIFEWLYKGIWLILGLFVIIYLNDLNKNIENVSNKLNAMTEIIAYKNDVNVVEAIDTLSKNVSNAIDNLRILR
ncbi:MAG: hypothetical protein BHW57_04565 [Azospirillum sp. 47_25]|nr:MAG: hypothetical protein BHW57_04565 [Azospirillum sp. 47_25]